MKFFCSHCDEEIPTPSDAFCPYCQESLEEYPPTQEQKTPFDNQANLPLSDVTLPSFGAKSARLSWQIPIAGVLVNLILGTVMRDQRAVFGILLMFLAALGLLISTIALFSIARFGWRQILIPASIGLILNVALLSMFLWAMQIVKNRP